MPVHPRSRALVAATLAAALTLAACSDDDEGELIEEPSINGEVEGGEVEGGEVEGEAEEDD